MLIIYIYGQFGLAVGDAIVPLENEGMRKQGGAFPPLTPQCLPDGKRACPVGPIIHFISRSLAAFSIKLHPLKIHVHVLCSRRT